MHPIKSMIGYFNIHINTSLAFIQWRRVDSNHRHAGSYQKKLQSGFITKPYLYFPAALPTELLPHMQSDFEAKLWATFPLPILSHRRFDFRPYPSYLSQDATTRSLEKPLILLQDLHLHSLNISGQFTLKALCLLIRLGTRIFSKIR